jgi:hypothetical protein
MELATRTVDDSLLELAHRNNAGMALLLLNVFYYEIASGTSGAKLPHRSGAYGRTGNVMAHWGIRASHSASAPSHGEGNSTSTMLQSR